jgi:hypothetical protein
LCQIQLEPLEGMRNESGNNLFANYLYFLCTLACHTKMDLTTGQWQQKVQRLRERRGRLRFSGEGTWNLIDPCEMHNKEARKVFTGLSREQVDEVVDCASLELKTLGSRWQPLFTISDEP